MLIYIWAVSKKLSKPWVIFYIWGNYINNVTFDEIYSLFEFDKTLKNIILKYSLEIETVIKSIMANQISKIYGVKEYLKTSNWDSNIDNNIKESLLEKIKIVLVYKKNWIQYLKPIWIK